MNPLRQQLRAHLRSVAELFASADAAREFQIEVPQVFAPTEIFCKWFDDAYLPESAEFISTFSSVELGAIHTLSASLEKLSIEAGNPPPAIEKLVMLPSWPEVEMNAKNLLSTLNA